MVLEHGISLIGAWPTVNRKFAIALLDLKETPIIVIDFQFSQRCTLLSWRLLEMLTKRTQAVDKLTCFAVVLLSPQQTSST